VPTMTPDTVYGLLEGTALDIGPPGFDFDSGFGLIQADGALAALLWLRYGPQALGDPDVAPEARDRGP
jgi:hypothetical protein